jgi:hypothetical protein
MNWCKMNKGLMADFARHESRHGSALSTLYPVPQTRVWPRNGSALFLAKTAVCYRVHDVSAKKTTTTNNIVVPLQQTHETTTTTTAARPAATSRFCGNGYPDDIVLVLGSFLAKEDLTDLNIRSILVMSGTLSRLSSYQMELGLVFPRTRWKNPHIIEGHQNLYPHRGAGDRAARSCPALTNAAGTANAMPNWTMPCSGVARVTPGGMLVFFPSHSVHGIMFLDEWGGPGVETGNGPPQNGQKNSSSDDSFAARRGPSSINNHKSSFCSCERHVSKCHLQ